MNEAQEHIKELLVPCDRKSLSLDMPNGLNKQQRFAWKVKNDFPWYAENFLKIRNKKGKLVPLKLNDAQLIMEQVDKFCIEHNILRRYIILKARQMGMSTYTEAKMSYNTFTNKMVNTMIITQEDKATQNLFNMSKLYYEELPNELKPMRKKCNEKALVFENPTSDAIEKTKNPGLRSKYTVATANTPEAGRSSTVTNLHASEVAFWSKADVTMTGLMQVMPDEMDTLVILESTANGVGGYFYDMWQQAIKGESDFIPIFLPWFTDPGYTKKFESNKKKKDFIEMIEHTYQDDKGNIVYTYLKQLMIDFNITYEQCYWYWFTKRNKCQNDDDKMFQEYPSRPEEAFISSGRPKFNMRAVRKYLSNSEPPKKRGYLESSNGQIVFVEDEKGYISIWKEPKPGEFYCIGADVAEGLINGDYSCGQVGDNNFDIVAQWYGHIDPDLFGIELIKLAKYYNDAYIGVEANNHGLTTLKAIQYNEYWNIYYSKVYDKITDQLTQKMGWQTNAKTKPMMIDKLAEFIREEYLGIKDKLTISEMLTYVIEDNGSTNAQTGCHDDTIMSLAILLQLLLEGKGENYVPEIECENRRNRLNIRDDGIIDPLFESNESNIECT